MAALALSNRSSVKNSRDKDIELEIKRMNDEEILDRTPMLDISIAKWTEINNIKKASIQIFQQNSTRIRDALKKLTKCVGLDSFEQLPLVFKKTEQQMSNINMYKEKLEVQNKIDYVINKQNAIFESGLRKKEKINQDNEESKKLIDKNPSLIKKDNNIINEQSDIIDENNKLKEETKEENNNKTI